MADLPQRSELFRRFRNGALSVPSTRISPSQFDLEGSDANLLAAASSIMGEEVINRMARALAGLFEATAEGEALDRVVFDRKGISRKGAAPSLISFELARPTAAAGAGTVSGGEPGSGPPTPTRVISQNGITYLLTQDAVFGAADLGPITVTGQAQLAGLDSEVGALQTWSFVDTPFDPTITVSNPIESAGAADEETDDTYRRRARDFFPTLRRGTLEAILFGLNTVDGVDSASVQEVLNPVSGFPACAVQGFVLDALGQSNQTLAAKARNALVEFRAAGIPVVIFPGSIQLVNIRILLTFDTALVLDTVAARTQVQNVIVAALNNLNPGETLERSLILAAARSVRGVRIADGALLEPTGDLIPTSVDIAFRTKQELIETS